MMDIRSEKDFELGFQIKKIFFVYETGQGTAIVYHSKDTNMHWRSKNTTELKQKSGVNLSLASRKQFV